MISVVIIAISIPIVTEIRPLVIHSTTDQIRKVITVPRNIEWAAKRPRENGSFHVRRIINQRYISSRIVIPIPHIRFSMKGVWIAAIIQKTIAAIEPITPRRMLYHLVYKVKLILRLLYKSNRVIKDFDFVDVEVTE